MLFGEMMLQGADTDLTVMATCRRENSIRQLRDGVPWFVATDVARELGYRYAPTGL